MKHWELTPNQKVKLTRKHGEPLEAQFLFRDTVRACFQVLDDEQCGEFRQFQLMDDGSLKDSPTREQLLSAADEYSGQQEFGSQRSFAEALKHCERWEIVNP